MRISCSLAILSAIIASGWVPDRAFCEEQRNDGQRKIVVVVANGTGLNKKDALTDAYRNAVQQVVGLYVDAETLVKNNALVRDKVLTTSNGFIVDSKEVASRMEDGLVRVTIRARVESTKLVAGLTAARITIRKFDGESLFGKALTKMERKENLQQTLLKILLDLGPLLKADIDGKPDFDTTTSELVFQIKLQADLERFSLFRKRLGTFLQSVCIRKVVTGVRVEKGTIKHQTFPPEVMGDLYISVPSKELLWGPRLTTNKQWVLWLQTFENKSFTTLQWTGYVLDTDWRPVFQTALRQNMTGYLNRFYSQKKDSFYRFNFSLDENGPRHPELGRTFVTTNFRGSSEALILFDKFELFCDTYRGELGLNNYSKDNGALLPPALVNFSGRAIGPRLAPLSATYFNGVPQSGYRNRQHSWHYTEGSTVNLFIAPVMLALDWRDARLAFRRFSRIERRIKIKPEELRGISKIDLEIEYTKPVLSTK